MQSIKQIDKPEVLSVKQHNQILYFLSRLVPSNEGVKHYKNIFCYKDDRAFKLLDDSIARLDNELEESEIDLRCKAMAKYLMGDEIKVRLLGKGKFLKGAYYTQLEKGFLSKYYLYPFFEDKKTVSDNLLYMWNDLLSRIGIQLIGKERINMYIRAEPMDMFSYFNKFSFEYYLDFDREELLKKEIELGYTNKIIGDKSRGYGYTHLLRANVGDYMIMPSSAIRLILGWSKYNTYLTSRKQGKTSFAADRVVAELLSEKKGYGMRKSRRIKFFTDNATRVGNEVMEYIKDFLGDLKEREIKPGLKYFDIIDSKQEVRCNLTGSVFNVISLAGLKGDSDNSTGDGLACDCAIIDEGFRITERFWRSFKDRAFEECEWILFISTLNEETEISHWGYREMIKGECFFEGYNTVRSSDFDNTITYFNNFKMQGKSLNAFYNYTWDKFYEKMKEAGESYVMKRMLCSIHSDRLLFNINGRITGDDKTAKKEDLRIIGLDPGGLSDHLGICIFNAATCIVEDCISTPIKYDDILPKIEELKIKYRNCLVVGDLGGPVGNTIFALDKDKLVDYWMKTASNTKSVNNKNGYSVINKGTFVLNGAYMLHNIAMVHLRCKDLIEQFGNMEAKVSSRSNTMMYEAKKGRKDDAVFSFLNVCALLRIQFGLLSKEDIMKYAENYGSVEVYNYDDDTYYYTGGYIY